MPANPPAKPKVLPPKPYIPEIIPKFTDWAAGRTGFSTGELEEIYAKTFGLTPEALKKLELETKKPATKTLAPKEVTPAPVTKPITPTVPKELIIARTHIRSGGRIPLTQKSI